MGTENLLDDRFLFTQAGRVRREFNRGARVAIGLAYTYWPAFLALPVNNVPSFDS